MRPHKKFDRHITSTSPLSCYASLSSLLFSIHFQSSSWWGRDFPPVQTGPGAHPASCTMGTGSFPGVKCGRGVLLTTHPLLVPRSWKGRAIPLPPLWATTGPVTRLLYFLLSVIMTLKSSLGWLGIE